MPVWHRPPAPVKYQDRGDWKVEPLGNVFRPGEVQPGQLPLPIAYTYGPEPPKGYRGVVEKTQMWTCPVCAIPTEVFELLQLYHQCRLMNLPPVAGGFLDQPLMVRRSFPIFEQEMASVEDNKEVSRAQHAAAAGTAAVMTAMFGKG